MAERNAAQSISLTALGSAVDAAIKAATARHHTLRVEGQTLLDRWEIIGRRLDTEAFDAGAAFRFAEEVAANVKLPGLTAEPAVSRFGRHTWVGFIARSTVPVALTHPGGGAGGPVP